MVWAQWRRVSSARSKLRSRKAYSFPRGFYPPSHRSHRQLGSSTSEVLIFLTDQAGCNHFFWGNTRSDGRSSGIGLCRLNGRTSREAAGGGVVVKMTQDMRETRLSSK